MFSLKKTGPRPDTRFLTPRPDIFLIYDLWTQPPLFKKIEKKCPLFWLRKIILHKQIRFIVNRAGRVMLG